MMKKAKKIASVSLILSLLSLSTAASAATFSDVKDGTWYAPYVNEFAKTGLINGYGNGNFGPDDSITRAQFVQILYNVLGKPKVDSTTTGFSDATGWYVQALSYAQQNHLLDELPVTNQFNGDHPLTRGEAARLIWNLLGTGDSHKNHPDSTNFPNYFTAVDTSNGKQFLDTASFPEYAKLPIEQLSNEGVIHGFTDGTYKADLPITRAESTILLDTALKKVGYPSLTVTQKSFIGSMFQVLSHASTMENYKVSYVWGQAVDTSKDVTTADGGGYTTEKVGIVPEDPNGHVTAKLAAQWLSKWAKPARNVSMDVNVSSDPFVWAKINGWFDGTSISKDDDVIQPSDIEKMNQNLQAWLIGYRQEGNTVYLHFPMVPFEPMFKDIQRRPDAEKQYYTTDASIQQAIIEGIQKYNHAKISIQNGVASYYEDPSTTQRVFYSMAVIGVSGSGVNANYKGITETYPIQKSISTGSKRFNLEVGPTNSILVHHGGFVAFDYSLNLNASMQVTSVDVGNSFESDGSIIGRDGNIITNYPAIAQEN